MAFEPLSLITGAALGVFATIGTRWWQYRRENWSGRVDYFCRTLSEVTGIAAEYWLTEVDASKNERSEELRLALLECKIAGVHAQLDGIFASFGYRFAAPDRSTLQQKMNELSDALTGGNFEVKKRLADPARAKATQVAAGDLIILTRTATDRAITLRGLVTYLCQRRPYQQLLEDCFT